MKCPRCAYDKETVPELDPEIVKEFFRSLLGNRPFVKEYPLLDGQLLVSFSNLMASPAEELDWFTELIDREIRPQDSEYADSLYTCLRLYYHLETCSAFGGTKHHIPKDKTSLIKELEEFKSGIANSTYNLLVRALGEFLSLKNELYEACFNETFYKGAGRV